MAVGFLQYHYLGAEYLNYFVAPCPCIGELKGLAFALMVLLEHHLLQELQHKLHFYDVLLAPFFSINVLKSAPPLFTLCSPLAQLDKTKEVRRRMVFAKVEKGQPNLHQWA